MLISLVSSCYQQRLDHDGKGLPGTNTLAYLASSSFMKKKSFITLGTGVDVIKRVFSSLLMMIRNKLECLSLRGLSDLS